MKYFINGKVSFVFWDKDCIIYHHNSGNTHLINDVPEVLLKRCLSAIPYDQEDLLRSIQQYAEFAGQDLSEYINQLLAILIKKDLIEQLN
ncbi:MAG: hypothetical protein GQ583_10370 [Methyloprofundus sp.]|nr:hypothetical protein [Methyloprofundus sp.]